jgi:hypothetical protein
MAHTSPADVEKTMARRRQASVLRRTQRNTQYESDGTGARC